MLYYYYSSLFFFLMIRRPPRSTLFPYTTLFRSGNKARTCVAREPVHAFGIDPALREVVGTHRLDAHAARERQVRQLVRRVVGPRRDDAVARSEVEGGHRLAEGHGRVLDDGQVSGRGAQQTRQQLVRLAHAGLGFVLCLVAADRRFALEVPGERLEHCLRHERGARVVEMDAIPAARRFAAPAIEVRWGGRKGGGSGSHIWKGRGNITRAQGTPVRAAALPAPPRTDCALQTTHSPGARRVAACTRGTSASRS